jgi:excisionase family DNA binding protein
MQPTEVTQEWVDYPTAERYSGLSHTTLWRYVTSGEIKAARVGRSVRIHLPTLRRFMERHVAESYSPRCHEEKKAVEASGGEDDTGGGDDEHGLNDAGE